MPAWGFGMPPPGFNELIAQKYAIMQQHANAESSEASANANLTNVKAGLLPTESAADVAKTRAETAGLDITNRFLPSTLGADALDRISSAKLNLSNAGRVDVDTTIARKSLLPASSLFGGGGGYGLSGAGLGGYGGFGLSL